MSKNAETAVANGVRLLDEKRPAWFLDIDLGGLTMSDPCLCVLGYVGAAIIGCDDPAHFDEESEEFYLSGYDMLVADWFNHNDWDVMAHGFEATGDTTYADLQQAWVNAILIKRGLPPLLDNQLDN